MKKLELNQMGDLYGGSLSRTLSCVSQVAGGMGVLWTAAAIGIFALGPIGWIGFGFSVISLAGGVAADPSACDN